MNPISVPVPIGARGGDTVTSGGETHPFCSRINGLASTFAAPSTPIPLLGDSGGN